MAGLIGLIIGGALLSTGAEAKQLRFALGSPPGTDTIRAAEIYAEHLEEFSNGNLSVRIFPLSLLNFAETSAGVRDGIADIGYLLTPYFPNEYPHTNLLSEISMIVNLLDAEDPKAVSYAYTGAMLEYVVTQCPECQQEYARQNQVFTASAASPGYILQCTKPVETLADLRGTRVRAGGPQWARWVESVGATPVTVSLNEAFEALSQGVVDCTALTPTELVNFRLMEPVSDLTLEVPGGLFAGLGPANVNADTWRAMSEENRQAMLRAAAYMAAATTFNFAANAQPAIEKAQSIGVVVGQAHEELIDATREFVRQDLESIPQRYKDLGVERGEEMVADMYALLERWINLVNDVKTTDDLAELLWEEVLSTVDVSTYGIQ
ncbi:MAG: C4-dicarboxylate TRAP transporter substrate-binding protein [Ectothiorhodospiraceae bacterium]|nr:C4-dicarboxylate TRAP transporter substrate-binding protein [Ectothiorhodospiraceae bacterium]